MKTTARARALRSRIRLRASASPYTSWAGFYYDAGLSRQKLKPVLIVAAQENIRCVGLTPDLLDLYEEIDRVVRIRDKRWVIGHVSILTKDQIARTRDLGLAVSTHTNRYIWRTGSRVAAEIGNDREDTISPLASMKAAGIRFALATDNVPTSLFYPIWQSVARIESFYRTRHRAQRKDQPRRRDASRHH